MNDRPRGLTLLLVLIGLALAATAITSYDPEDGWHLPYTWQGTNPIDLLSFSSINLTLAVGMTLVILTGEIDLSVGRMTAQCYMAFVLATNWLAAHGVGGLWAGVLAAVLAALLGGVMGLVNGVLVVLFNLPSFIITLGTYMIYQGTVRLPTNGQSVRFAVQGVPDWLITWLPVAIAAGVAAAGWWLLNRLVWGRYIYAVGGGREAALVSGVPVPRVRVSVFVVSGLCSGLAGIIQWARLPSSGNPLVGEAYELFAIAAVVLGGTTLAGGEGTLTGSVLGALILGLVQNTMGLKGISPNWQNIITGGLIILAVLTDQQTQARQAHRLTRLAQGPRGPSEPTSP